MGDGNFRKGLGDGGPTIRPVPGWDNGPSNSSWQSFSRNSGNVKTDFFNGEIARLSVAQLEELLGIDAGASSSDRAGHRNR